jgi:hypothetical protein
VGSKEANDSQIVDDLGDVLNLPLFCSYIVMLIAGKP